MAWRKVTDKQWAVIEPVLPRRCRGRGRPAANDRRCFEGILWILWTGCPWSELPARDGSKSTVHRRLMEWTYTGVLLDLWRVFLAQLDDRGRLRWDECFIDGMFVTAKKGGRLSAPPSAARERSSWYWPMARVLRSEWAWRRRPRRK
jgi:transposase